MAVIEQILGLVDATVIGVAAQTYDGVLTAVRPVVAIASTLTVALVGANLVLQTVPLTVGTAVSLALRITLVNVFLVYGNITAVYLALTEAPAELGAGMLSALSGATVTNLYDGLDDLYRDGAGDRRRHLGERRSRSRRHGRAADVPRRLDHGDGGDHRSVGGQDHDRRSDCHRAGHGGLHAVPPDRADLRGLGEARPRHGLRAAARRGHGGLHHRGGRGSRRRPTWAVSRR